MTAGALALSPRTVLLLHSSSDRYGSDRQLELIAQGLDPGRYVPLVVLPADGPLAGGLRAAGIEVIVRPGLAVVRREVMNPSGLVRLAGRAMADARWLRQMIARRDVALVHSNTSAVLGGAAAARLAGVPHVWHIREIYAGRFGRVWPTYRRLLMSARRLLCVSEATAVQFGATPRVRVVLDGLALDPWRAPGEPARAALGLPPAAPVIALIGRISDWKGQDVLVRALASPPLQQRGAVGLLAGDVWPGAEDRLERVLELAGSLDVRDRLVLCGFREDLENVYGAADVVVVPSTRPDPLPGSAVEAAAAGCAVVAAAHGGLPEIIRDGETGRLVTPGDAEALAVVVAELLDDPAMAERLGAAAALDVRARFAAERLPAAVQDVYDDVLGEKVRGGRTFSTR